ncbi:cyclin-dependent kinase inhibitor 2c-related [Anaeramoeba flamelloides]|uniref:Cyclin-dependent kinase inhibitor 2c-related n=1 Tax=Anaeramoeba flamelloides TaxID=1746091 RepID=A0AAV8A3B7_9EUKA|nr:cyclin-dependent kinase inhibitor 2c-related [Anaeramoeba flamelloides]
MELIKCRSNINALNGDGCTPLHLLCRSSDDHELIRFLLENNANPNHKTDESYTALHIACKFNPRIEIIKNLHEFGAALGITTDEEMLTALHLLCEFNPDYDILKFLIEKGAKVNALDKDNNTPLHLFLYQPNISVDVLKLLINNGADYTIKNTDKQSALHLAIVNKHVESFELIENQQVFNLLNKTQKYENQRKQILSSLEAIEETVFDCQAFLYQLPLSESKLDHLSEIIMNKIKEIEETNNLINNFSEQIGNYDSKKFSKLRINFEEITKKLKSSKKTQRQCQIISDIQQQIIQNEKQWKFYSCFYNELNLFVLDSRNWGTYIPSIEGEALTSELRDDLPIFGGIVPYDTTILHSYKCDLTQIKKFVTHPDLINPIVDTTMCEKISSTLTLHYTELFKREDISNSTIPLVSNIINAYIIILQNIHKDKSLSLQQFTERVIEDGKQFKLKDDFNSSLQEIINEKKNIRNMEKGRKKRKPIEWSWRELINIIDKTVIDFEIIQNKIRSRQGNKKFMNQELEKERETETESQIENKIDIEKEIEKEIEVEKESEKGKEKSQMQMQTQMEMEMELQARANEMENKSNNSESEDSSEIELNSKLNHTKYESDEFLNSSEKNLLNLELKQKISKLEKIVEKKNIIIKEKDLLIQKLEKQLNEQKILNEQLLKKN